MNDDTLRRRPIRVRSAPLAQSIARWFTRQGVTPNQVSIASVVFAAIGGAALAYAGSSEGWIVALLYLAGTLTIELRLLANLLDGMIAVEGGKHTPSGELFNEVPDRFSDAFFLVGAGYATADATGIALGWAAALLAVMTAYVRALGSSMGLAADFSGPFAKPQRMQILAAGCVIAAIGSFFAFDRTVMFAVLALIVAGTAFTVARRVVRIHRELIQRSRS